MTIVYILLFIVCLSTLIMVHEAGHLATAKIFKVYCFEYAIGFGPRLFSFKRKGGETRFSLRAIPFGGFVSMYGEADAKPEDVGEIDPSRSLENIKKWKKGIIMSAGIVMNFVLALVIFFIYNIAFPAHVARVAHITVKKGSIAYDAGLRSKDYVYATQLYRNDGIYFFYDDEALLTYADDSEVKVYFGYDYSQITLKNQSLRSFAVAYKSADLGTLDETGYTEISYSDALGHLEESQKRDRFISGYIREFEAHRNKKMDTYYVTLAITENYLDKSDKAVYSNIMLSQEEYKTFGRYVPVGAFITLAGDFATAIDDKKGTETNVLMVEDNFKTTYPDLTSGNALKIKHQGFAPKSLSFDMFVLDKATNVGRGVAHQLTNLDVSESKLPKNIGIAMQLDSYYRSYGDAVKYTFEDFSRSATLIYRGLGQLFTKDGIKNVGGIIAIGVSTTQVLVDYGIGMFLYYWAIISVNLGIVNLLPFPGLDGWHLLVTIVEGVSRKEIPSKVKNVVSLIGLGLLFGLMILIIIKDIITVI